MQSILDNEVVLIGKIVSGIKRFSVKNQKACELKIKIDEKYLSNTIPIVFINPNEEQLKKSKNKDISIIGHIEAKWNVRIIVDAYKIDEEDIQVLLRT